MSALQSAVDQTKLYYNSLDQMRLSYLVCLDKSFESTLRVAQIYISDLLNRTHKHGIRCELNAGPGSKLSCDELVRGMLHVCIPGDASTQPYCNTGSIPYLESDKLLTKDKLDATYHEYVNVLSDIIHEMHTATEACALEFCIPDPNKIDRRVFELLCHDFEIYHEKLEETTHYCMRLKGVPENMLNGYEDRVI